jgi:predicted lipid-binding transport protein (Tim44 family)
VATLTKLCDTKPGKNINFDEDIYNTTQIKISSTSPNSTSSSLPPVSPSDSASSLSKGAIAGIVLGGLVLIAALLAGILVLLQRAKKRREGKTIEMPTNAPSAAAIPNTSYQYAPVQEHKYAHQGELGTARPVSELATTGPVELPPTSPPHGASELGTGGPYRGHNV